MNKDSLKKDSLKQILVEALKANHGKADIVQVCKYVWDNYSDQLKNSGELFYTWQYDIRWAAHCLRKAGIMKQVDSSVSGHWELARS